MAIPKSAATIAILIALLGTGCTQPDPNAAPTYTCTPSDGATPHPCYKAEHDQQVKEDALYAEAEAVYRKYLAEEERIYRIGGITEPTTALLETTSGAYLSNAMVTFEQLKSAGATVDGGEFALVWAKRQPALTRPNSVATLLVCVDASSVMTRIPGHQAKPGRVFERTIYFADESGTLKLAALDVEEVSTC